MNTTLEFLVNNKTVQSGVGNKKKCKLSIFIFEGEPSSAKWTIIGLRWSKEDGNQIGNISQRRIVVWSGWKFCSGSSEVFRIIQ